MRPLSTLERTVAAVSAWAIATQFSDGLSLPVLPAFVAFASVFGLAEFVLLFFLLMMKNGGGWPD